MDLLDVVVGSLALLIAIKAFDLQRKEVMKNSKINALIHTSELIQKKIDYHNRIIADLKSSGKDFNGHAHKINKGLRPLKDKIDIELITLSCNHDFTSIDEIRAILFTNKK